MAGCRAELEMLRLRGAGQETGLHASGCVELRGDDLAALDRQGGGGGAPAAVRKIRDLPFES